MRTGRSAVFVQSRARAWNETRANPCTDGLVCHRSGGLSPYVVVMQVSVTEVNSVLGTARLPLVDLLRAAVTAGQDIEAARFRGHPVSQLMRRFRKEVGARSRVLHRRLEGLGHSSRPRPMA
jgi:hypothetical protein